MTASWIRPGRPLVVAHRGLRAHVPEQTMPSFRAAIEHGAEMIEADALLSSDGELVLMHDDRVDRTTDGHGRVAELTWDALAKLDAGAWFGPEFAGFHIPRPAELLDLAEASGIKLCLEAKGETTAEATAVAVALARLVADRDATSWAFVSGFNHEALAAAHAAVPSVMLAPERIPERGCQTAEETLRQVLLLGASVVQHRWELITPALVDTLHEAGIGIWAWNTNDLGAVRVSTALGVDAVMGDDVDLLLLGSSGHQPWVKPQVEP